MRCSLLIETAPSGKSCNTWKWNRRSASSSLETPFSWERVVSCLCSTNWMVSAMADLVARSICRCSLTIMRDRTGPTSPERFRSICARSIGKAFLPMSASTRPRSTSARLTSPRAISSPMILDNWCSNSAIEVAWTSPWGIKNPSRKQASATSRSSSDCGFLSENSINARLFHNSDHRAASEVLMARSGILKNGVVIIPARSNSGIISVIAQIDPPVTNPAINPARLARFQYSRPTIPGKHWATATKEISPRPASPWFWLCTR